MSKQQYSISNYLGYYFFRFLLFGFRLMPFWVLYRLSDLLYLLLYYLIAYRKKVVRQNLSNSFPEKELNEIKLIEKQFFRHLADIFLEGIKGLGMSDKQVQRRWHILTPEQPNDCYAQGQASIFVGAHYNNWEWGALATGLQVQAPVIIFYKPVRNPLVDQYLRKKRMQKGVLLAPIRQTSAVFAAEQHKMPMYNMIADQSPSNLKAAHWMQFLNQETGVLHGPAKYARRYNNPMYFIHIDKVKRGHYEISAELLIEDPGSLSEEAISRRFMDKVEAQITKQPAYWLWSHKRWKHQRPQ